MFMLFYLAGALAIGAIVAFIVTRANHSERAKKSGIAAANKQRVDVGQPAPKRSPGAD